jgi:formiminotetrahydrofolate cyclodeaminase
MLADLTITEFSEKTASGEPLPGGGSVSALAAALAAALAGMVANLTVGKKGYEDHQAEMQAISAEAGELRNAMLSCSDRDADAYQQVLSAFGLPRGGDVEQERRRAAIQEGFKQAARVPLSVAADALKILELAHKGISRGNRNAASDGIVAALMAKSAVLGALSNVHINLEAIKDQTFVHDFTRRSREIREKLDVWEPRLQSMLAF